jgi:GT2 family glycosyltransferase
LNLTRYSSSADETIRERGAALQRTLVTATASAAVAWIDPSYAIPEHVLAAMCAAFDDPDVAAVTLRGCGRTITTLGVPTSSESNISAPSSRGRQVLYAPAGLAVLHRARVLSVGGIDTTLAYGHEDANLGWRLALRGLRSVEISMANELGPSPSRPKRETHDLAEAKRLRYQTSNQLATLFVCAGDEWLRNALPAAIARVICLAAADAGLRPDQFDFSASIPDSFSLPLTSVARLLALDDLVRHFPDLKSRRAAVQAERRRADEELCPLLSRDPVDSQWEEVAGDGAHALCRMLGLSAPAPAASKAPMNRSLADDGVVTPMPAPSTDVARVSVIVLTALGPTHLPDCLDSLAQLDYPAAAVEVVVVDNGSKDDPTDVVHRHYPNAVVVRTGRNLGFCGGNNAGVAKASHEWLLFLNDDTRVDPGALRALLATASRRRASAVGAFVLDWDGAHVDFAGGGINFDGHGFQDGIGSDDIERWAVERPIAFANGAAMLVHRDAYLDAGGFPDRYFAYYEDVALGWALWLRGQQIWLSRDAVVFHKHHGTAASSSPAARQRNLDRNACFTVLTHSSPQALPDLLCAALLLAAERVVMSTGLGGNVEDPISDVDDRRHLSRAWLRPRLYLDQLRAELRQRGARRARGILGSLRDVGLRGVIDSYRAVSMLATGNRPASRVSDTFEVRSEWVATLGGVAECCRDAGQMELRRAILQARRHCDERVFVSRFPEHWLDVVPVVPARQGEYNYVHRAVVEALDLERFKRHDSRER